jgi:hypothetical protein
MPTYVSLVHWTEQGIKAQAPAPPLSLGRPARRAPCPRRETWPPDQHKPIGHADRIHAHDRPFPTGSQLAAARRPIDAFHGSDAHPGLVDPGPAHTGLVWG